MKRTALSLTILAGALAASLPVTGAAAAAPDGARAEDGVVEGRYIVVYEDSARHIASKTERREDRLDFATRHRFRHALPGFSAKLSATQLRELEADPAVDFVSPVRRYEPAGEVPLAPGESPSTGVRRIEAVRGSTAREASGVGVAVIDTGVQLNHPDLNVVDGANCSSSSGGSGDVNGHGTVVAGIIGARNNGSGTVGVAPATPIFSVKVFNNSGGGDSETVACGIEWVAANHAALGIKVANMSLTGAGDPVQPCESTTDAEHLAVCNATAAGVSFVAATGNEAKSFDAAGAPEVPAAFPEVLAVTAMADSDGAPGGSGLPVACGSGILDLESDDTATMFSNFSTTAGGAAHTVAAPGHCIRSTAVGSGYETTSGTSFAAPHVTGIVAQCINEAGVSGGCAGMTPAQVVAHIRGTAEAHNTANPNYGFTGDPLHSPSSSYYGFLVTANPPPACQNLSVTTAFRTSVSVALACAGSGQLNHEIVSGPANGKISGFNPASGALTYTPDGGFTGNDTFTYRATAANGTSNTATVTISVSPPPAPVCKSFTAIGRAGQPKAINLDCAGRGAVRHEIVAGPGHGDVSGLNRETGRLTYTADSGFTGQDSLTYAATNQGGKSSQATVTIDVRRPSNKFTFGGVKRNEKKGSGKLVVRIPGPGRAVLKKSSDVKRDTKTAAVSAKSGKVKLKLRPRGAAKRKLARRRCGGRSRKLRARTQVKVTYRPEGGTPRSTKKRVKLVRSC